MLLVYVFDCGCLQLDTPQHATAVCTLMGNIAMLLKQNSEVTRKLS